MNLTKTVAAAAIATTALTSAAAAGGLAPAAVDPVVTVIEEPMATRSSWGIILPIAALVLLIALAGGDSDTDTAAG